MKSQLVIKFILSIFCIGIGLNCVAQTKKQSPQAPAQTSQFGQLVGHWKIADKGLGQDGKWQDGNGADWNFYWILNGSAIQDDWISPSLSQPEPKSGRQYGTNIRIFNPKKNQWEMAWASNSGQKVDTFTATENQGEIVMKGFYNGAETRITFFDIKPKRFSWKMETQDAKGEWRIIYRIEATRVTQDG